MHIDRKMNKERLYYIYKMKYSAAVQIIYSVKGFYKHYFEQKTHSHYTKGVIISI